jgi:hypothetical protein
MRGHYTRGPAPSFVKQTATRAAFLYRMSRITPAWQLPEKIFSKIFASGYQLFPESTVTSFNSGLIVSEDRDRPM